MTRVIYANVILAIGLTDWLIKYFNPETNAGNWLAAAAGAFVIRFAFRGLLVQASVMGWLTGFILSCLLAPSAVKNAWFGTVFEPEAIWGLVAFCADALLQLIAFGIRLTQKVGSTIYDDPGAAFDDGLERVEKVTNVWVRIKVPFMDLLNTVFKRT